MTHNPGLDTFPSWSPDGTRIAFVSIRHGAEHADIYIMNTDGSNLVQLTQHPASDSLPVWSPDGTLIAFVSTRTGNADIYTIKPDGTALTNLTNNLGRDSNPSWSPNGNYIAFDSLRAEPDPGPGRVGNTTGPSIYIMQSDGSNQRRLLPTSLSGPDLITAANPVWSPDGRILAFTGEEYRSPEWITAIYALDVESDHPVRLTADGYAGAPAWTK